MSLSELYDESSYNDDSMDICYDMDIANDIDTNYYQYYDEPVDYQQPQIIVCSECQCQHIQTTYPMVINHDSYTEFIMRPQEDYEQEINNYDYDYDYDYDYLSSSDSEPEEDYDY